MAVTLALFGYKDRFATTLDHFLAWSKLCKLARQAHSLEADAGRLRAEASKRATEIALQRCPTESSRLLTKCFVEFAKQVRLDKHQRELAERQREIQEREREHKELEEQERETRSFVAHLEQERMEKDRQLTHTLKRIRDMEDTLEKELTQKQELIAKLHEAHVQMRQVGNCMSIASQPCTPRATPRGSPPSGNLHVTPKGDLTARVSPVRYEGSQPYIHLEEPGATDSRSNTSRSNAASRGGPSTSPGKHTWTVPSIGLRGPAERASSPIAERSVSRGAA